MLMLGFSALKMGLSFNKGFFRPYAKLQEQKG